MFESVLAEGSFVDSDPVLSKGEHFLPFDMRLPRDLPGSFEGYHGRIVYKCEAVIEKSTGKFSSIKIVSKPRIICILALLALNYVPEAAVCCFCFVLFSSLSLFLVPTFSVLNLKQNFE